MKGDRLADYSHIEQQTFRFDYAEQGRHTLGTLHTDEYSEHIPYHYPVTIWLIDMHIYPVQRHLKRTWILVSTQPSSNHQSPNPSASSTNNNTETDLQSQGATAMPMNSEKSVPQNPFFRPFHSDTAKSNVENPKRGEHVSRTIHRVVRRSNSASIPRSNERGTSSVKSQSKNRQGSGKDRSVSRENAKIETVVTPGAKKKR